MPPPDRETEAIIEQVGSTPSEAVARRLREARKAAGLTQAEVAKRIGVNRRAIHEWEAGTWQPHRAIPELADVYGVSPTFLLFGVEPASVELQHLREQVEALTVDVAVFKAEITEALVRLSETTEQAFASLRTLVVERLHIEPSE